MLVPTRQHASCLSPGGAVAILLVAELSRFAPAGLPEPASRRHEDRPGQLGRPGFAHGARCGYPGAVGAGNRPVRS